MQSRNLGWTFILGGITALGLGSYVLHRQRKMAVFAGLGFQAKPKGRLVTTHAKPTPIVEENRLPNGMKVQHRRSNGMPIEERVANIQDLVWKSTIDPEMRKLALALTHNCPERDGKCEAQAIYKAMKKRIRYTGDVAPLKIGGRNGPVEPIDFYQSAKRTWEFRGGDCDDHAILAATLLTLNGIQARLRVTAEDKNGDWGHIYTIAGLPKLTPNKWFALDTTLPGDDRFGYEVPFAKNLDFPV